MYKPVFLSCCDSFLFLFLFSSSSSWFHFINKGKDMEIKKQKCYFFALHGVFLILQSPGFKTGILNFKNN